MSLNKKIEEKMCPINCEYRHISNPHILAISQGKIGSYFNEGDAATIGDLQFYIEDIRLWTPLLIGRYVVRGLIAMLPINIGLAASTNSLSMQLI
jgi:hypothetical protein